MRYVVLLLVFASCVFGSNPYSSLIGTTWTVGNSYVSACINNCGTCCITNFNIQQNGNTGASMNVYFYDGSINRCKANIVGPYSMTLSLISESPFVAYGSIAGGPDTKATIQFFSNSIGLTYNDSSNTVCSEAADIVGTYHTGSGGRNSVYNVYTGLFLIVILVFLF